MFLYVVSSFVSPWRAQKEIKEWLTSKNINTIEFLLRNYVTDFEMPIIGPFWTLLAFRATPLLTGVRKYDFN